MASSLSLPAAWSMVDLTTPVEEALDGRVETVQRHQHADLFSGQLDGRGLERVEHGALATGQVQAGGAVTADGLEHLLHQLELVGGEGVVADEVQLVGIRLEGHADMAEGELVLEDVALGAVDGCERRTGLLGLAQQALLDDLVDVGAGKGQAGLEAALDLGEVIGPRGTHLAQDGVDVLLRGDHDPSPAAADGAEVLGDGLQVEHEMGVLADELADLVHQEDDAVAGASAVQVLLDPAGEILDGQEGLEVVLRLFEPGPGPLDGLAQSLRQCLHQLVRVKAVAISFQLPVHIGDRAEGALERSELALERPGAAPGGRCADDRRCTRASR